MVSFVIRVFGFLFLYGMFVYVIIQRGFFRILMASKFSFCFFIDFVVELCVWMFYCCHGMFFSSDLRMLGIREFGLPSLLILFLLSELCYFGLCCSVFFEGFGFFRLLVSLSDWFRIDLVAFMMKKF